MGANDLRSLGFVGQEFVDLGDRPVVGDDGETVVVHVEDEVLAHDGQADQRDVALRLHVLALSVVLKNRECRDRVNPA